MKSFLTLVMAVIILVVAVYSKKKKDDGVVTTTPVAGGDYAPAPQVTSTKYAVIYKRGSLDEDGVSNALSEILEMDLAESDLIAKMDAAIVSIYDTEAEAKNLVDDLDGWEVSAEICPVVSAYNFNGQNLFRVDKVFNVTGKGTTAVGAEFKGSLQSDSDVVIIRKDGTVVKGKIKSLEMFGKVVAETVEGTSYGVPLEGVTNEQVQSGDVISSLV